MTEGSWVLLFIVLTNISLELILVKKNFTSDLAAENGRLKRRGRFFLSLSFTLQPGRFNGRGGQLFIDTPNLYTLYSDQKERNATHC